MKPIDSFRNRVIQGDCIEVMRQMPADSVDTVITSPPYWGLRSYEETEKVWGGDPNCEHEWSNEIGKDVIGNAPSDRTTMTGGMGIRETESEASRGNFCCKCGAWKGQLGLEPTFELYIDHLMQIFDEVKRVLKPTGSFWLSLGDTYGGSGCGKGDYRSDNKRGLNIPDLYSNKPNPQLKALQPKCLVGVPWRVALRMIDEHGWILRNDICWYKPNHMPSSVKDRLTNSWEHVFHFVKSRKYFYDLDAIREPYSPTSTRWGGNVMNPPKATKYPNGVTEWDFHRANKERLWHASEGKNPGDMWSINTEPFPDAHFAVFPEELCIKPILASCPKQVCKECGKARVRITKAKREPFESPTQEKILKIQNFGKSSIFRTREIARERKTIGWTDCGCGAGFGSGIVLDPMCGSGTALVTAYKLGRDYIGIDISEKYVEMTENRLRYWSLPERERKRIDKKQRSKERRETENMVRLDRWLG